MNLVSGALTQAGAIGDRLPLSPRPPCAVARSDSWERAGRKSELSTSTSSRNKRNGARQNLDFQANPPYLMLGYRATGSRVPMVGARTVERVLWTSDVPAAQPLAAVEGSPAAATMTSRVAYAAYVLMSGKALRVAGFALLDGQRLWEAELPINDNPSMVNLVASDQHVFVFTTKGNDGRLRSLSSTTGQLE